MEYSCVLWNKVPTIWFYFNEIKIKATHVMTYTNNNAFEYLEPADVFCI